MSSGRNVDGEGGTDWQIIEMDPGELIHQLADAVVASPLEAIVELVTNADDSYRRMEARGAEASGRTEVFVKRRKSGALVNLSVADKAEGMDRRTLEQALVFARATSGRSAARSVRGLFGRGLKEAILALGKGRIVTVKDEWETVAEVGWVEGEPKRRIVSCEHKPGTPSGTKVEITPTRVQGTHKGKVPGWEKLKESIARHYALRRVAESPKRTLTLTLEQVDERGRRLPPPKGYKSETVRYSAPAGAVVAKQCETLPDLGQVEIVIREAEQQLHYAPGDPTSQAGLCVTAEGAPLDLIMPGFEGDEASRYFFGEVECRHLAHLLWEEKRFDLIRPDRGGLKWSQSPLKDLHDWLASLLAPLVERKKQQLQAARPVELPEKVRKRIAKLCELLTQAAREELEADVDLRPPGPGADLDQRVTQLTVIPSEARALPGKPRFFTVYLPLEQAGLARGAPSVEVELDEVYGRVTIDSSVARQRLALHAHGTRPDLLTASLSVVGEAEGHTATIVCTFRDQVARAKFTVQTPRPRPGDSGAPRSRTGGMFRDVKPDPSPNPIQRTWYSEREATIYVCTEFPTVGDILGARLERAERPQGATLLAELVAEAFCRLVARRQFQFFTGTTPEQGIEHFMSAVDTLRRKYAAVIYEALGAAAPPTGRQRSRS